MTRIEIATQIFAGICAGDWKFDIKDSTWDAVATSRAVELADKLIAAEKPKKKTRLARREDEEA